MVENNTSGLVNQAILNKIDQLRELNVSSIDLPQLVVVGDQSSGKSSVLESLTGFSFPQAPGLCTRYATQISCRRDPVKSVTISIIPSQDADSSLEEQLHQFKHSLPSLANDALADVIRKSNSAMGIRMTAEDTTSGLQTFSGHKLKIEISGPDQEHFTVIDVPGIFRVPIPPFTTDSDVALVKNMVTSEMRNKRTIILAVLPSNVDITTQEVLKMAEEADPEGNRTMGVLTKPDLVKERATQETVNGLLLGNRNNLRLGYYVVRNRGADDRESTMSERLDQEKAFFESPSWSGVKKAGRCGIPKLKARLSDLLMTISKNEFPHVMSDITKLLQQERNEWDSIGPSRSEASSQRLHLGKISSRFQTITQCALKGYYDSEPLFADIPSARLITAITNMNEKFANDLWKKGHKRHTSAEWSDDGETLYGSSESVVGTSLQELLQRYPELRDIVVQQDYKCPNPTPFNTDSIMDNIDQIFRTHRGAELGTFSGAILAITFKEQTEKWEPLVLAHVSKAIAFVHDYAARVLCHICPDTAIRTQLWQILLAEKFQEAYGRALEQAQFLLDIERGGKPSTFNHYFNSELQRKRNNRLVTALTRHSRAMYTQEKNGSAVYAVPTNAIREFVDNKDNAQQVREDILDILVSYYKVARKRFVDVVCMQVIHHFLLEGEQSPLKIFTSELVMGLSDEQLEHIAGENDETKECRAMLEAEIESLERAMKVLLA